MNAQILETLILPASDAIHFRDGSGLVSKGLPPLPRENLAIRWDSLPADVKLIRKPSMVALWRNQGRITKGKASTEQKERVAESSYVVGGAIHDPTRTFNPRLFAVSAGNAAGHALPLYRSPFGTRTGKWGFLHGNLIFADLDARPASWALLTLTVTIPVQPQARTLTFQAQADINGDFILSLSGLPFIKKDAPYEFHTATLKVNAAHAASGADIHDPDTLEPFTIKSIDSENFLAEFALDLTPDSILRMESNGAGDNRPLVLKK